MSSSTPQDVLPFSAELQRKALHLLALIIPLGMAWLGKTTAALILVPGALLALLGDVLRVRSPFVARWINTLFGGMMRPSERPPVGAPVSINGATWVLLSAAVLTVLFPVHLAAPSLAVFMIADAVAALVGRRLGRLHWGRTARTVEGSAGFLLTGLAVFAALSPLPFWIIALSVGVGCLAEAAPRPLNDNLRVPFTMAAVLFLLERFVLHNNVHLFWAG